MFDPALVALTTTPSIAGSSAELTSPVSAAAACACAGVDCGHVTANAMAMAAGRVCRIGFLRHFRCREDRLGRRTTRAVSQLPPPLRGRVGEVGDLHN